MSSLPLPRYREIADRIQGEIASGKWPVGEKLAPEQVLEHGFDEERKMKFIKIYFNEDLAE